MHNLHVYNAEKYIIFNGDFARENFASTGIRTHIFFIQAAPPFRIMASYPIRLGPF